ncbi:MAG: hypothetical protein KC877_04295 [Candidatus Kaiserbacteria bacterium]|nr:hypothetical protein [Candidatus Kaiserbacteria bacterium]MCB9815983.1 hypothetical protein [Candidatus Nomurabacteria bacterium]
MSIRVVRTTLVWKTFVDDVSIGRYALQGCFACSVQELLGFSRAPSLWGELTLTEVGELARAVRHNKMALTTKDTETAEDTYDQPRDRYTAIYLLDENCGNAPLAASMISMDDERVCKVHFYCVDNRTKYDREKLLGKLFSVIVWLARKSSRGQVRYPAIPGRPSGIVGSLSDASSRRFRDDSRHIFWYEVQVENADRILVPVLR